jgi:hypothetical protein
VDDPCGIAHALGVFMAVRRPGRRNELRRNELVGRAERVGVLIDDDQLGHGWRVADEHGTSLMPRAGLVFADKILALCFWNGLGRPGAARLFAVSDPMEEVREQEEGGAATHEAAPRCCRAAAPRAPRPFTLVEGGRDGEKEEEGRGA